MIKTIKGAMRSPRYKKQKLFVLTDAGAHFKYRFCVIGIPAEMYRLTRYFRTEIEACAYFEEVFERKKDFVSSENRGFESVNFENKKKRWGNAQFIPPLEEKKARCVGTAPLRKVKKDEKF